MKVLLLALLISICGERLALNKGEEIPMFDSIYFERVVEVHQVKDNSRVVRLGIARRIVSDRNNHTCCSFILRKIGSFSSALVLPVLILKKNLIVEIFRLPIITEKIRDCVKYAWSRPIPIQNDGNQRYVVCGCVPDVGRFNLDVDPYLLRLLFNMSWSNGKFEPRPCLSLHRFPSDCVSSLGLPKSRPDQEHADYAEGYSNNGRDRHHVRPERGLLLGYKILFIAFVFSGFGACLRKALSLFDRGKDIAGLSYLSCGVSGVLVSMIIGLPLIFS